MALRAAEYVRTRVDAWRSGSREGQWFVAALLLAGLAVSFVVSLAEPDWMPLAAYFVWLLLAMMLLRFGPLVVVAAADAVLGVGALAINGPLTTAPTVAMGFFVVSVALVVFVASLHRSGLPAPLTSALLVDLKERLQAQGQIPPLPDGWESQSAMIASRGVSYAGDFLVADLAEDGLTLEVILVDVCGKGTTAGPAALQFAGALGGLIGAMQPERLFKAANDFLLRQGDDEAFSTAVHLLVRLDEGSYQITSAGHPPALRWDLPSRQWVIDNARGTALGVQREPDLHVSKGRLFPGEALLFYTDGVVESRSTHIDAGIAWLQRAAQEAVGKGFGGAARRIIGQVESGEDDRAVLILNRTAVPSPASADPPGQRGRR